MSELYKQAQTRIPATISFPSTWLRAYEDFVSKNAGSVTQIESALRSLTYIVPGRQPIDTSSLCWFLQILGRFRESEIASESLHTTTLLLSLYHTSVLRRHFPSPSLPSPHSRYITFFKARSRLYANSNLLLQTIQYTELLCEMFFKRRGGDKARWRLVVALEMIKAICRMIMMWITGRRMVIEGTGAERPAISGMAEDVETVETERKKDWNMPRTGMKLPALPTERGESITDFLTKRVISADDIKAANRLVRKIGTLKGQVAEVMWILRPVVYALAMQRLQGRKKRDWRPWLLGFAMELAARELGKNELRERVAGGWRGMTGVEKEELQRRGWGLAWWGMRGAFYENVTRSWIGAFAAQFKEKPLLDMVGSVIEDYDYLWDEYYFSTSTM
ncbi:MAG: hypothetical protein LQ342_004695 [Letrouitia transgressa]|nr:MAG: hypothetical protein LQ342_004695 [Letrouitia transgressa]